jgi:hypothetical protein
MTVLVALLVSVGLHRPLLAGLGTVLPGEPASDAIRAWWSMWLVAAELPGWPFGSTLADFPAGVDWLPFPAVTLVLSAPVAWLFGAKTAVGVAVLAHSMFAVGGTAFFVRSLGGRWGVAACAGALVASQPVFGGALRDGTLEVLAVGWLPLVLGCMVRACRTGSWRWGVATGVAFLVTCVESVYYGSWAALGVLAALATLGSPRRDWRGPAAAAATVAVGVLVLGVLFYDVVAGVGDALEQSGDTEDLRAANAASWEHLKLFAVSLGARGWTVGDTWGPPLAHWVVFGVAALAGLRRTPWLSVLGVVYLGLALHLDALSLWWDNPIGEVVRFPRRAMAPMAVALSSGLWAFSRLAWRWPRIELAVGCALGLYLSWWGAHAGGLVNSYPTLTVPDLSFLAPIAEDDEDCAVLFLPLEIPGAERESREDAPVFGDLGAELATADHLAMQATANKMAWGAPGLVTLHRRQGYRGLMPGVFTDFARAHYGGQKDPHVALPVEAYAQELEWLRGLGLKYVVVDTGSYDERELARIREVLAADAEVSEHGRIEVYRLYDERPPEVPAPTSSSGQRDLSMEGVVAGCRGYSGRAEVRVDQQRPCPVNAEDCSFDCGIVPSYQDIGFFVDDQRVQTSVEGYYTDLTLRPE